MIVLYIVIPSRKTNSRQVSFRPYNHVSILSKSPFKLLTEKTSAIDTTKSNSKPNSASRKSKNSRVVPMNGGRKRTKTKKRRATKKKK